MVSPSVWQCWPRLPPHSPGTAGLCRQRSAAPPAAPPAPAAQPAALSAACGGSAGDGGALIVGPADLPIEKRQLVGILLIPLRSRRTHAVAGTEVGQKYDRAAAARRRLQPRGHLS